MRISESELILNPDGSIYHLHLRPEQLAKTVITVGDPERVAMISAHFDNINHKVQKREFVTHTGTLNGKELTVISTGIGTDNIDIVLNELDALVNIDLETRTIKQELTSLDIYRVGTSGSLQTDLPLDSFVVSETGIGFDNLLYFYDYKDIVNTAFSQAFIDQTLWPEVLAKPYVINANAQLLKQFEATDFIKGNTVTNVGFYGPQGRTLRLGLGQKELLERMENFKFKGKRVTNLEMETAAIYAMAKLLGHRALSLNVLLANRSEKTFSKNPKKAIELLIVAALNRICQ